jgi:hypothetical protein
MSDEREDLLRLLRSVYAMERDAGLLLRRLNTWPAFDAELVSVSMKGDGNSGRFEQFA